MDYTNNTAHKENLIPSANCSITYRTQANDLSSPVLSWLFSNRHNEEHLNFLFFTIRTLTNNGSSPSPYPHGKE